jgi:hypothetical protein
MEKLTNKKENADLICNFQYFCHPSGQWRWVLLT